VTESSTGSSTIERPNGNGQMEPSNPSAGSTN
jgi:hypothetical protein